jgi:hypothetical protein
MHKGEISRGISWSAERLLAVVLKKDCSAQRHFSPLQQPGHRHVLWSQGLLVEESKVTTAQTHGWKKFFLERIVTYFFFPVPVYIITASGVPGSTFVSMNRFSTLCGWLSQRQGWRVKGWIWPSEQLRSAKANSWLDFQMSDRKW